MNLYLFKFIRPSGLYISLSLFIARRAETEVVQKKTKREQLELRHESMPGGHCW